MFSEHIIKILFKIFRVSKNGSLGLYPVKVPLRSSNAIALISGGNGT